MVFPTLRPINIIVLVITVIESLRAFDLVYAINSGRNGLELLSVLVTQNIVGEASRIGYGSAIAVDPADHLDRSSSSSTCSDLPGGAAMTRRADTARGRPGDRAGRRRRRARPVTRRPDRCCTPS